MKNLVEELIMGKHLNEHEAYCLMTDMAREGVNQCQIASVLTIYRMRLPEIDEILGFRSALLDMAHEIKLDADLAIDLCGTGGDGKDTFNISTLTSFIVAGAGYKVTKHGNYGVSSSCGSSDVLNALGYKFTNSESELNQQLEKANICFLHAPLFHPALKNIGPIRKQLGIKTLFNIMGPLINPSRPSHQISGTYSNEVARVYEHVLSENTKNFAVIHASDGYDELSLTSDAIVRCKNGTEILNASHFNLQALKQADIKGGIDIASSSKIFTSILEGEGTTAQNNVVLANAALAIRTIEGGELSSAYQKAKESLESKSALKALKTVLT